MHVLPIHLAPLRERREDIMPLAEAFLLSCAAEEGRRFGGFEEGAARRLVDCDWPGNVRQLANLIRQIVVLGDGLTVDETMLPPQIGTVTGGRNPAGAPPAAPAIGPLWRQERDIIETALAACGGNIARAAAALEISPSTIYRKRQSWSRALAAG